MLFACAAPLTTQAQQTKYRIHGLITDSVTREALPYVSVRIKNSSYGCSSDNNGNFSFLAPINKDTIIISSIGYKEKRIALTVHTKLPLKVRMSPEMYELSEITIKPKKEEQPRSRACTQNN